MQYRAAYTMLQTSDFQLCSGRVSCLPGTKDSLRVNLLSPELLTCLTREVAGCLELQKATSSCNPLPLMVESRIAARAIAK